MTHPPTPPSRRRYVSCCSCSGKFGLAYEAGSLVAYHTLPYCSAFEAIESTDDVVRHSEKCRMVFKPS